MDDGVTLVIIAGQARKVKAPVDPLPCSIPVRWLAGWDSRSRLGSLKVELPVIPLPGHFAHLFDEFSVPHLMLAAGITTNGALLLWALRLRVLIQRRETYREGIRFLSSGNAATLIK